MPRNLYFSPCGRIAGRKSFCPPVAGRQGIGSHANPFHNLTAFIREIRAKKNGFEKF
jgi:hypothetical protein